MSLQPTDLVAIRQITQEELQPIETRLGGIDNGIKEIYGILVANGLNIFID